LKHAGYEVVTYASAKHLLDRLPSDSVLGCILLDVRIPGLSGPELQERLSKLGSALPIIFLTGHPDIPTTVRTIKGGAEDFLTKPVSSHVLLQAIERAIAHHEVTRGLKSKLDIVRAHIAALTPREREVFALIVRVGNLFVCFSLGEAPQQLLLLRRQLVPMRQCLLVQVGLIAFHGHLRSSSTATAGKLLSSPVGINVAPTLLRSVHARRRVRDHRRVVGITRLDRVIEYRSAVQHSAE
jgi:FixJ family two-component response regulator